MPNEMPGSGKIVYTPVATPTAGVGISPTWRGSALAPPVVVPLLSGQVLSAQGYGTFDLSGRVPGHQGSIDLLIHPATLPVAAATGTIRAIPGSDLLDTETFTLDDGTNPASVFEFDLGGGGVTPGNVAVVYTAGDTNEDVRDTIVTAVNGVGAGLAITAAPGAYDNMVALTNDATGVAGNVAITDTVANTGFIASGMSGGRAAGSIKTVFYLTDSLTSPTNYIALNIDASNRPILKMTNNLGTVVANVTPSYTAITAGYAVRVQIAWDSVNLVDATRHATLLVNGVAIPSGNWSTDPTAAWDSFRPAYLVVGKSLSTANYDGTVESIQISTAVL